MTENLSVARARIRTWDPFDAVHSHEHERSEPLGYAPPAKTWWLMTDVLEATRNSDMGKPWKNCRKHFINIIEMNVRLSVAWARIRTRDPSPRAEFPQIFARCVFVKNICSPLLCQQKMVLTLDILITKLSENMLREFYGIPFIRIILNKRYPMA